MRKSAAIILSAAAIVMFSSDAEARRLRLSFGKSSAPTPAAKPAAANAGATTSRGGTFVVIGTGTNQNRPMAAAPRGPVPEGGPLHDLSVAAGQFAAAPEKPVEPVAVAEKPAEQPVEQPPAVQITPVFISQAAPVARPVEKPAERVFASAQPVKTVYCVRQANGACAPF